MGLVQPPQRKGRIPQYSRDKLSELQAHFDTIEGKGVFRRPEDLGIVVEYLNPSFLVKKASGGHRLVTAFADVGRYSKPQPSLMPSVNSTLQQIASWKFIITTDLTSAFYQIPLARSSMKYCGVVTPFKGIRVYTRSAMGMPESETALEELMSRVLGDLIQEGIVAKLADDLYCGGNTPEELVTNWRKVLTALHHSDLHLAASKTVIAPKSTTILGWIWSEGTIQASPHRLSALATCEPPSTVKDLRSFIGAFKVLSRVIPQCAKFLIPLDKAVAGLMSNEKLLWSDDLSAAFEKARSALSSAQTIYLPKVEDQLWIVTDGAVRKPGLGATLYITREDGKPKVAGFFSSKLKKLQVDWLPCEVEALCIAASIQHFSPYIIQSNKQTCVLTDNKPCVQAFSKLCRGEFSVSPRVATFLTAVSRFQISLRHLSGSANLPSDFQCRNAPECVNPSCKICAFVQQLESSVVRNVTLQEIITGSTKLPFITRSTWLKTQSECPDLRRTHAHLIQGTRPSKKATNIRDIKRYLQHASIAKDGLLVVKRQDPFSSIKECIIVPKQLLPGLLHALHIKLDHPSLHHLKQVVSRYFFALDMDRSLEEVTSSCHLCASLRKVPHTLLEQSTSEPPAAIGTSFCADVMRHNRQFVLVLRETVTSFTTATIIENEEHSTLRDNLIRLCIERRPLQGPLAIIRTDPAPGFLSIKDDPFLSQHRICLEIGRRKNPNKNPVAERAIQELELELLHQDPSVNPVSPLTLSLAVSRLNSRLRHNGLSSREMWSQRDQFTNSRISVDDEKLILEQQKRRQENHPASEKSKAPKGYPIPVPSLAIGDIVYLYADRNKHQGRDRYIVISVDNPEWCNIRKFSGKQLRQLSYRVRQSACYKVPSHFIPSTFTFTNRHIDNNSGDSDVEEDLSVEPPHDHAPEPGPEPPVSPPEFPSEIYEPHAPIHQSPLPDNTLPVVVSPHQDIEPDTDAVSASPSAPVPSPVMPETETAPLRRSNRLRKAPKHFDDYVQF